MIDILAGFFFGILCGTGVGSGGLPVLYFTLYSALVQKSAQGTNLVFFIAAASFSLLIHARQQKIDWGAVAVVSAFGCVVTPLGAYFASSVNTSLLRKIYGVMLIVSGIITLAQSYSARRSFIINKKDRKTR